MDSYIQPEKRIFPCAVCNINYDTREYPPVLICANCATLPLGLIVAHAQSTGIARWRASKGRPGARQIDRDQRHAAVLEHGKECPSCLTVQPAAAYYADKRRPDGLQAWCKACQASQRRERRAHKSS